MTVRELEGNPQCVMTDSQVLPNTSTKSMWSKLLQTLTQKPDFATQTWQLVVENHIHCMKTTHEYFDIYYTWENTQPWFELKRRGNKKLFAIISIKPLQTSHYQVILPSPMNNFWVHRVKKKTNFVLELCMFCFWKPVILSVPHKE